MTRYVAVRFEHGLSKLLDSSAARSRRSSTTYILLGVHPCRRACAGMTANTRQNGCNGFATSDLWRKIMDRKARIAAGFPVPTRFMRGFSMKGRQRQIKRHV